MPIIGTRIPVKLPWKGATDNTEQFVSMKEPVAKWLGLSAATQAELEYTQKVDKKNKSGEKDTGAGAQTTIKRRRRPGFRQRSVRVSFGSKAVQSGGRTKRTPNKKKIGGATVASVQFPITKSVPINDIIKFFESGAGKSLGVKQVTDVTTGQSYPIV